MNYIDPKPLNDMLSDYCGFTLPIEYLERIIRDNESIQEELNDHSIRDTAARDETIDIILKDLGMRSWPTYGEIANDDDLMSKFEFELYRKIISIGGTYLYYEPNPIEPEIVVSSGTRHRLTITPTRVTVKLLPNTDDETKQEIMKFVSYVQSRLLPVTQSWRGSINFLPKRGTPMSVETSLQTDGAKRCIRIKQEIEDGRKISR